MKWLRNLTLASLVLVGNSQLLAAPLTGKTGPGGFELADGASNLQLWLKADQGLYQDTLGATPTTTINPNVARWEDQSGYGRFLTQGATTRQPVLTESGINNLPVVSFKQDNTTDVLSGGFVPTPGTVGRTVFIVAAPEDPQTGSPGLINLSADSTGSAQGRSYSITTEVAVRVFGNQIYDGGMPTSEASLLTIRAPQDSTIGPSGNTEAYINSLELGTTTGVFATINSIGVSTEIGRTNNSDSNDFRGDMAEVAVFDRFLNEAEKLIVENYLSARYNLGGAVVGSNRTLGAFDRYEGDLDGFGNFDYDLFGVGQVDALNLVSTAGAAGFGIEITSGLADGEWVMAAHRVPNNTLVLDEELDSLRWEREWYVDVTGADLNATLAFDFSDAGLSFGGQGVELLYTDSLLNDWQTLPVPGMGVGGGMFTFELNGALFQSGYYTLAVRPVPEPSTLALLGLGSLLLIAARRKVGRARRDRPARSA